MAYVTKDKDVKARDAEMGASDVKVAGEQVAMERILWPTFPRVAASVGEFIGFSAGLGFACYGIARLVGLVVGLVVGA